MNPHRVVFLGGDRRSHVAAGILRRWGYETESCESGGEVTLRAVQSADAVILPTPATVDGRSIYSMQGRGVCFGELVRLLGDKLLVGGKIPVEWREKAVAYGATAFDLTDREALAVKNALPTAEGALSLALSTSEKTIKDAKIAILGYGRISKCLTPMFLSLGAEVTVLARREESRAQAALIGAKTADFNALDQTLFDVDFIVNTVPKVCITAPGLALMRRDAFIIDLASSPGGVDRTAAEAAGIRVIWALGLPGKVAPVSAGEYLAAELVAIFEETTGKETLT